MVVTLSLAQLQQLLVEAAEAAVVRQTQQVFPVAQAEAAVHMVLTAAVLVHLDKVTLAVLEHKAHTITLAAAAVLVLVVLMLFQILKAAVAEQVLLGLTALLTQVVVAVQHRVRRIHHPQVVQVAVDKVILAAQVTLLLAVQILAVAVAEIMVQAVVTAVRVWSLFATQEAKKVLAVL
jgi:hypothetical protein